MASQRLVLRIDRPRFTHVSSACLCLTLPVPVSILILVHLYCSVAFLRIHACISISLCAHCSSLVTSTIKRRVMEMIDIGLCSGWLFLQR
ncbi:hypothetical protein C8Q73DRAFT_364982 [Cubamyces lactineus]|nr:hypothetical protein C8Q73DRAFT_364982 [Cubamyces lactineus]